MTEQVDTPAELGVEWVGASLANQFDGRGGNDPTLLISHVMQGHMAGTEESFNDPQHQASAHFGISATGKIVQYVNLRNAAFANGPLRNPNVGVMPELDRAILNHINPNYLTIAVEWEGIQTGVWVHVPDTQGLTTLQISSYWQPTQVQWVSGIRLYTWLLKYMKIKPARTNLGRHSDFDNVTKGWCPGKGFVLANMIMALGGHV